MQHVSRLLLHSIRIQCALYSSKTFTREQIAFPTGATLCVGVIYALFLPIYSQAFIGSGLLLRRYGTDWGWALFCFIIPKVLS